MLRLLVELPTLLATSEETMKSPFKDYDALCEAIAAAVSLIEADIVILKQMAGTTLREIIQSLLPAGTEILFFGHSEHTTLGDYAVVAKLADGKFVLFGGYAAAKSFRPITTIAQAQAETFSDRCTLNQEWARLQADSGYVFDSFKDLKTLMTEYDYICGCSVYEVPESLNWAVHCHKKEIRILLETIR